MSVAQEGEMALLISPDRKRYLVRLAPNGRWHSHRGIIEHADIIGQPLGRTVYTQHGYPFLVLEPSTEDLLQDLPRITQIIYGKDAAQIVMRLNLYPGRTVVEAGTGSGGLTIVLARTVMSAGHVFSYDTRSDTLQIARRNLDVLGLLPFVTLRNEDIAGGFHETEVDSCFLDVREPWLYLSHAWAVLKGSGYFGSLIPTTNQVSELLTGLQALPFGDIAVEEVLVRSYKPVAARLRPEDRMLAHSAYLVFARKIAANDLSLTWIAEKRRRSFLARQAMARREAEREADEGRTTDDE